MACRGENNAQSSQKKRAADPTGDMLKARGRLPQGGREAEPKRALRKESIYLGGKSSAGQPQGHATHPSLGAGCWSAPQFKTKALKAVNHL